jgi:uncharacterized protein (DUF697 family)
VDAPPPSLPSRSARARALVHEHVLLSGATALIPDPLLCTTALTGVHLRLVDELSRLYGVPFAAKAGRALLIGAGAGLLTKGLLAQPFARRLIAAAAPVLIPLWFAGGAVLAGTFTHFLGEALIGHYEAGGTFADFDWKKFRDEAARRLARPFAPAAPAAQPA